MWQHLASTLIGNNDNQTFQNNMYIYARTTFSVYFVLDTQKNGLLEGLKSRSRPKFGQIDITVQYWHFWSFLRCNF